MLEMTKVSEEHVFYLRKVSRVQRLLFLNTIGKDAIMYTNTKSLCINELVRVTNTSKLTCMWEILNVNN